MYVKAKPYNVAAKDWYFRPEPINHWLTYHFQFDPTQTPKRFEERNQYKSEKAPGTTVTKGIYRLEGDTLLMCFAGYPDKGNYPSEFKSPKENDRRVYVLKRER